MRRITRKVKQFLTDDSGQGMLEYILIVGLIVLVIIVALYAFRDAIKGFITKVTTWMNQQGTP
ncbi:MAG TPA: Flp family type IVb pilin [Thermoanaerobaculia bacterium]|nr:Flp family type IVb pilin [Thermoanaerobaculia bacterium]